MLFSRAPKCGSIRKPAGFKLVGKSSGGPNVLDHPEMFQEMGRSHFCFAPSGDGFTVRMKLAIALGCIPIVVQDEVQVGCAVAPYSVSNRNTVSSPCCIRMSHGMQMK